MDDQSSTPMSDFLLSLQRKPADTTVLEAPAAAPAQVSEPVASEVVVVSEVVDILATIEVPPTAAQGAEAAAVANESVPAASEKTATADVDGERAPAWTIPDAPEAAVAHGAQAIHANKVRVITKALRAMENNIANIIRLLEEDAPASTLAAYAASAESVDPSMTREAELNGIRQVDGRVIEGVFDGQSMVGSDGKIYTVPPNYASKSKLVEGDMLKLTITSKGSFIYKQIGPIERSRVVATLGFDATNGEYYATQDNRRWTIIKASVTYFKGEPEDEVILLVPKNAPSRWAAVENIIKQTIII
jgi:hypothetical protein